MGLAARLLKRKSFPKHRVPAAEVAAFAADIRSHPEFFQPGRMRARYRDAGASTAFDPFGDDVALRAAEALRAHAPFSVIRIGDGEANFLAYGEDPRFSALDAHLFEESIWNQADRFELRRAWMAPLSEMMISAVACADIVGVLGVWQPNDQDGDVEAAVAAFARDLRGVGGQWRGRRAMLRLAEAGAFRKRLAASAYLYLGVNAHLATLMAATDRVLCVTDRSEAVAKLSAAFPDHAVTHCPVGRRSRGLAHLAPLPDAPHFMERVRRALPDRLDGVLCLVGAGPWAEIYCTWIKRRGGVAIDLGSGFDLLAGAASRPMHRALTPEMRAKAAGPLGSRER